MTEKPGKISIIPTLFATWVAFFGGLLVANGVADEGEELTAQATGCTPLQHAVTQIPYALIAAAITILGCLAIAFL